MAAWGGKIGQYLPATTRWYTFVPHLARQCGAMFAHRLLVRVLQRAHDIEEGSRKAEEGDGYHAVATHMQASSLACV